jgi:hypothetical protein
VIDGSEEPGNGSNGNQELRERKHDSDVGK